MDCFWEGVRSSRWLVEDLVVVVMVLELEVLVVLEVLVERLRLALLLVVVAAFEAGVDASDGEESAIGE